MAAAIDELERALDTFAKEVGGQPSTLSLSKPFFEQLVREVASKDAGRRYAIGFIDDLGPYVRFRFSSVERPEIIGYILPDQGSPIFFRPPGFF